MTSSKVQFISITKIYTNWFSGLVVKSVTKRQKDKQTQLNYFLIQNMDL